MNELRLKSKLLSLVSFLVLMEDVDTKSPDYILEKALSLPDPLDMFCRLDSSNQVKVLEWGKKWGIDFRILIRQIQKDWHEIPSSEYREKYFIEL